MYYWKSWDYLSWDCWRNPEMNVWHTYDLSCKLRARGFHSIPVTFKGRIYLFQASLVAQMQETQVQSLNWEEPLEKRLATHSSILVWRIPWTEEPGRLQSMGLQRVRCHWATHTSFGSFHSSVHSSPLLDLYQAESRCTLNDYVVNYWMNEWRYV